jgi:putative transposase
MSWFSCPKGQVLTQCRQRHRHQEYLGFLREIEQNVPETLAVHIIVDNYATHKHPRVKRWFAARPRFHGHFTPTYASRLNQVELWFNRITQQAIRRGTFRSVKELVEKIDQYVQTSNNHAPPFVWTATADSIFAKVQRLVPFQLIQANLFANALSVFSPDPWAIIWSK